MMNRIIFSLFIFVGLACEKDVQPEAYKNMEEAIEVEKPDYTFTYLALGDSYTIGESVAEKERFPVQLNKKLSADGFKMKPVKIIARTGWTTDELANGIKAETLNKSYNLVTLLIGVNNQYRGRNSDEYRSQFIELLQTAISFTSGNPKNVVVVSIPDYGVTPFAKNSNPDKIAKEIDLFNQINREETLRANAHYINITPISRQAESSSELIAQDGLHPSGEMYRLWVEKIFPKAAEILENQN